MKIPNIWFSIKTMLEEGIVSVIDTNSSYSDIEMLVYLSYLLIKAKINRFLKIPILTRERRNEL